MVRKFKTVALVGALMMVASPVFAQDPMSDMMKSMGDLDPMHIFTPAPAPAAAPMMMKHHHMMHHHHMMMHHKMMMHHHKHMMMHHKMMMKKKMYPTPAQQTFAFDARTLVRASSYSGASRADCAPRARLKRHSTN